MLVALEPFLVGQLVAAGLSPSLRDELRRIRPGGLALRRSGRHHRSRRTHTGDETFEIAPLLGREIGGGGVGHSAGTATASADRALAASPRPEESA